MFAIVSFVSCANVRNQATVNRYGDICTDAIHSNRLDVAEQACYRALLSVDTGNLGPEEKSKRLYNLALVKRYLAKYSEADDLLRQSLSIEEKLMPPNEARIGRRLVELSINLAALHRWDEGMPYLDRSVYLAPLFSKKERALLAHDLYQYGKKMRDINRIDLAERYESALRALKK